MNTSATTSSTPSGPVKRRRTYAVTGAKERSKRIRNVASAAFAPGSRVRGRRGRVIKVPMSAKPAKLSGRHGPITDGQRESEPRSPQRPALPRAGQFPGDHRPWGPRATSHQGRRMFRIDRGEGWSLLFPDHLVVSYRWSRPLCHRDVEPPIPIRRGREAHGHYARGSITSTSPSDAPGVRTIGIPLPAFHIGS